MGMGVPKGWEDNHFLEFAPNLRQLASGSEAARKTTPFTKEQMLNDFWNDLGLNDLQKTKPTTKKDLTPDSWEVREELRQMSRNHQDSKEAALMTNIKHPLLIKGNVDPKLKSRKERQKQERSLLDHKESEYVKSAMEKKADKSRKTQPGTDTDAQKDHTRMANLYKETRNSYHKKAAPTRFYEPKKKRLKRG
jgi:hypothetical protein|tara:strand:- start:376 stop:954 length:579 start_codon:yes stop_codon:yes gene_type:complete